MVDVRSVIRAAPAPPTGTLRIAASHDGRRTVIDTLRQEGLSKCSRPFACDDGAARLVTSQLGPGFVRGDRFVLDVTVAPGASLLLEAQAASRASGVGAASTFDARILVGPDAHVTCLGEPIIVHVAAAHRTRTLVALSPAASFAWLDVIAPLGVRSSLATSLRVEIDGRLALHDAMQLTPRHSPEAIGSAYYLRAGMSHERAVELVALADDLLAGGSAADIAVGVGAPACGGVSLRARGTSVRAVRAALLGILGGLRDADQPARARRREALTER